MFVSREDEVMCCPLMHLCASPTMQSAIFVRVFQTEKLVNENCFSYKLFSNKEMEVLLKKLKHMTKTYL